jgi:hypothetical protein
MSACRGDADVPAGAPLLHPLADPIDESVFLDAVLRPFGIENQLLALFLRSRDRNEVGADSASGDDLVGNALVREAEMLVWLKEGRIDDGIFNDGLRHRITQCSFR